MTHSTLSIYLLAIPPILFLSCKSWVVLWMMMEINSMSFLYWLTPLKKENLLILFIFQSFSSMGVLLMSLWQKPTTSMLELFEWMLMLMFVSVAMKMGIFPFHKWMVMMAKWLDWNNNFVLMSWQKVIPLILLAKMFTSTKEFIMAIISLALMSIIIISQTLLKTIFMASSIMHSSLMIFPMKNQPNISFFYLIVYSITLIMVINWMTKNMFNSTMNSVSSKTNTTLLMMSLSGVPPLVGFICKWMILKSMFEQKFQLMSMMAFVFSSCITFYMYMSICFKDMFNFKDNWKNLKHSLNPMIYWLSITMCIIFFASY